MENQILISHINDFMFCPVSIYFHNLYAGVNKIIYQDKPQILGAESHKAIDENNYSTRKSILQGIEVYSEKYNVLGKIDIYDSENKLLRERKRKIKTVYDGYVFQAYAQYFCLTEIGFAVDKIQLYSMADNKVYPVSLPEENILMLQKFENTIAAMQNFTVKNFNPESSAKCQNCIYEPLCDRSKK